MNENVIYTFKYFIRNDEGISFQMVTGNNAIIEDFEKRLCASGSVISAAREYVCEYDLEKMHELVDIKKGGE